MSPIDFKSIKISKIQARKKIAEIVDRFPGNVFFSGHSLEELGKDGLTTVDAWNVLKSPDSRIFDEGEFERGSFRYRLETKYIMVVIAFNPEGNGLNVVTAWDKRKKGG